MTRNPLTHLVIAAVIVIAALAASAFVDYRLLVRISEREALEASIAEKRLAQERNDDAEALLSEAAPTRDAINSYFVSSSDVVAFLERLEDSGEALGAKVGIISVSEVSTPRPNLVIALQMDGSFSAVMRALGAIEHGPYDVQITSLSLDDASGATSNWTAAVGLTVGASPKTP